MSTIQRIEDENRSKKAITNEKPVRRSERVRKQRYNIHPDDIGNNDDEKHKRICMRSLGGAAVANDALITLSSNKKRSFALIILHFLP